MTHVVLVGGPDVFPALMCESAVTESTPSDIDKGMILRRVSIK